MNSEEWKKIKTLYNGFFLLDAVAFRKEGIKKPLYTRDTPLIEELPEGAAFVGAEFKKGLVVLDFDNEIEGEKAAFFVQNLMQTDDTIRANILKTNQGYHIYFRNHGKREAGHIQKRIGRGNVCALGLECEYKIGGLEGVQPYADFEPFILNGEQRQFIGNVYSFDELTPLPFYFFHYAKRTSINGLPEGGRNQTLSEFAMGLQNLMPKEHRRDYVSSVCTIINSFVFDEPLPEKELNTILRDETFDKFNASLELPPLDSVADKLDFEEKGYGFKHQDAAAFIIQKHHIKRINGYPNVYDEGIYRATGLKTIIRDSISNISNRHIKEIFDFIAESKTGVPDLNRENFTHLYEYIGFRNGVWSNITQKVYEYSPERVCFFKLPVNYNPDAKSEIVDKFLNDITAGNDEMRKMLLEIGGYCLYPRNELGKAFFLIGKGNNGKSTFSKVLEAVLGEENKVNLSLRQLTEDKWRLADLAGKLVNISGELEKTYLKETDLFKKLVTGDVVTADIKYQQRPLVFENSAKFVFSGNDLPKTSDTSKGFMRRLIFIPFTAHFDDKEDDTIIDRLTTKEAKEYWLKLFLEAYARIIKNGFTQTEESKQIKIRYEKSNNHVIEFIEETELRDIDIGRVPTSKFYTDYRLWANRNGFKPYQKNNFENELLNQGFDKKRVRLTDKNNVTSQATVYYKIGEF